MSKSIDSNKQFMIGNGLLAFGVFFIVFLFLYLGFRSQRKEGQAEAFSDKYILTLDNSLAGDSLSVYINDSLLLNQTMKESSVRLLINRFAEESMLMVVDNHTEEITPFNLNPKGSEVSVEKKNGKSLFWRPKETASPNDLPAPSVHSSGSTSRIFLFSMIQHADQHFPLQRVSIAGRMYPLQQPEAVLPQLAFEHDTTFCLF